MARYFTFVFISNMVAVLLYHKIKRVNLEKKTLMYITGISLLMSMLFPMLLNRLTIVQIIFLYLPVTILAGIALSVYDRPKPVPITEPGDNDAKCEFQHQCAENHSAEFAEQVAIAMQEDPVEDDGDNEVSKDTIMIFSEEEQLFQSPEEITESEVVEEDVEIKATETKSIEINPLIYEDESPKEESPKENRTHVENVFFTPIAFLLNKGEKEMEESIDLLEACIDKGFDAKLRGEVEEALDFFIKAIRMSPPYEVMTLLVLDISTMYKDLGRYDEAIGILDTYLAISSDKMTDSLRRDITTNIEYLRIIKELLQKANTPNLPISRVPTIIKAAADKRLEQLEIM